MTTRFRHSAGALLITVAIGCTQLQAQTFTVLHTFTNGGDGSHPIANLITDGAGNLYGTASEGGYSGGQDCFGGCGTVFKIKRVNSGWITTPIYIFQGGSDGAQPYANLAFGPDGSLYGTTAAGGIPTCLPTNLVPGCGVVFKLQPPAIPCPRVICLWNESVLHRFTASNDGAVPAGGVTFDQSGNIYGTATFGGNQSCFLGCGTVWELSLLQGVWTEQTLWSFTGAADGANPQSSLISDNLGNLYGTATGGGLLDQQCSEQQNVGCGTVFELTSTGGGYQFSVVHTFDFTEGSVPYQALVIDSSGNLFSTTINGANNGFGNVFELSPSGGGWIFSDLYDFPVPSDPIYGSPALDPAGNFYDDSSLGGSRGAGSIFGLSRSGGTWTYADLFDFGGSNGSSPYGGVALDSNGNIYGTTYGIGNVWELQR